MGNIVKNWVTIYCIIWSHWPRRTDDGNGGGGGTKFASFFCFRQKKVFSHDEVNQNNIFDCFNSKRFSKNFVIFPFSIICNIIDIKYRVNFVMKYSF